MDILLNRPESAWRVGAVLIITTGVYFITCRLLSFRSLLNKIPSRGRRESTANTPPRSFSPKQQNASPTKPSTNYNSIVPPLRRESLLELQERPLKVSDVSEAEISQRMLPITADYRNSPGNLYTPTGFSVDEVKALGDFPDYATLSGVPLPSPYHEHVLEKALPRPYRPMRWGYHQTMSLTKLEPDWWIELESTYKSRVAQRKELYAAHGKSVLDALPGSELACKELMETVLQYVCARYPQYFSIVDKHILQNRILDTEQDVRSKPPLEILMDNIPEDFGIMLRDDKTGFYYLRAGVICSSLGWNVGSKIGKGLEEIHKPVPDYKAKMQFSMERFFTKMPTEKPIQRGSWNIEVGEPLYMPPEDPHVNARLTQSPELTIEDCNLRVDWQTLRRLPLSAAVVFNFKAVFTPVTEFRDEPGIPALTAKIMREGKQNLMDYKKTWQVEHVVLPKLDEWAKEQEDLGLMPKGWEVTTLDEAPWYRGWEGKWHSQQGF